MRRARLASLLRIGLLGLAAWLAPAAGWANGRPELADPQLESVGDAEAIADNVVSALAVDRTGFLWVGTAVGLVRYDGHGFRTMQARSPEGHLVNTFVRALQAGRDGRLWVGTDGRGLGEVDPQTGRWTLHPLRDAAGRTAGTVRALAEDADGVIWAGTIGGGLYRYDPRRGSLQHYGTAQGLPDARVQALQVTPDGSLWVGTWKGLARLPRGAQALVPVALPQPLDAPVISLLALDRRQRLWVGAQLGELLLHEPDSGAWQWLDRGDSGHGSPQALVEVEGGEVWIGRTGGLEIRQELDGGLQRLLRYHPAKPWGPAAADVRTLTQDASGVVWIGSYGGGLQKHVPNGGAIWVRRGDGDARSVLGVADARSMAERPGGGEIWVGTSDRGVAVLDNGLHLVGELPARDSGYRGGRAGALAFAPDGRQVYVASDEGVAVFDSATRRWQHTLGVGKGRSRVMRASADGRLWVGTQDGLYECRPGQSACTRLGLADGSPLTGDVNALAEQADGQLWVGGERGLYRLPAGARGLLSVPTAGSAESNAVLGLLLDRRGRLWMDSVHGLYALELRDGLPQRIDFVSERLDQSGRSFGANLLEDSAGRIWTHRGVYDPVRQQFMLIGQAEGVDIGTGWYRSYAGLRDGRLLFGGSRGILVVDPTRFRPWRYAPKVVATGLRIQGQPQALARLQPLLELAPGERSFAIEYAVLDLSQPMRNRYRHRLQGFEETWIENDHELNGVSYTGLEPGHYQLQVQGSNRSGQWSPETLMVDLEVLPAWWQTWWARALMGLLALSALALLVQWRLRQLEARQLLLEQRVSERTEQLEAARQQLEAQALTDPLTGLHNRRFVEERLGDDLRLALRRLEEAQRQGLPPPPDADLCFFLIDLDHFKEVNDRHGHAAGDAVLKQVRERLRLVFREADYLVRWGGEEFLVVARGTARRHAPELAERVRIAVVGRPFELPGLPPLPMERSCSVGFACWPLLPSKPRATGWMAALHLADAALYLAKREGRNRWVGVGDATALPLAQFSDRLGADGTLPPELVLLRGAPAAA